MVRGRGVLLDDEDAGRDAADGELLVALDAGAGDVDARHRGALGAVAEEADELVDGRRVALGVDWARAAVAVAHPAVEAEGAGRLDGGRGKPTSWTSPWTVARMAMGVTRASCLAGAVACCDSRPMAPVDARRFAEAGLDTGRPPVLAGRAMVVAPGRTATLAGLDVLRDGGNAVDAAIAVGAMLVTTQPHQCGLGGDAFWLVRRDGATVALDASGRSAGAASAALLRERGLDAVPERSGLAVTVPGVVDGWRAAHERFGTVELERLVAPARAEAEAGTVVTPILAAELDAEPSLLAQRAETRRVLLPRGRPPAVGERLPLPDLAATLGTLARDPRSLYDGSLAERLCDAVGADGGLLAPDDLAAHRSEWREPLAAPFAGWVVEEMPPGSQGVVALLGLRLAEALGAPPRSAERLHLWVEIARLGMAVRDAELGDPATMRVPPADLLDPARVERLAGLLDAGAVRAWAWLQEQLGAAPAPPPRPAGGDTVHFAVVDGDGLAVSCIQSVFSGFGTGIVVPGTGILLHNRGSGSPRRRRRPPEQPRPAEAPMHTLAPALATEGERTAAVFGCMGGHAQAQIHLQLLEALAVEGVDPATATSRPRWVVVGGEEVV